jgi:hypothetical protein
MPRARLWRANEPLWPFLHGPQVDVPPPWSSRTAGRYEGGNGAIRTRGAPAHPKELGQPGLGRIRGELACRHSPRRGHSGWLQQRARWFALAEAVPPREVIETVFAMFLMLEERPQRFLSDTAFRTQVTRRVRGLTETNAGEWFDLKAGRRKLAYRELPPRATTMLATWIVGALGGMGVHLGKLETRQRHEQQQRQAAMHQAAMELQ